MLTFGRTFQAAYSAYAESLPQNKFKTFVIILPSVKNPCHSPNAAHHIKERFFSTTKLAVHVTIAIEDLTALWGWDDIKIG